MKLQVDETTSWWNDKLMKWQVDETTSWWNDMALKDWNSIQQISNDRLNITHKLGTTILLKNDVYSNKFNSNQKWLITTFYIQKLQVSLISKSACS